MSRDTPVGLSVAAASEPVARFLRARSEHRRLIFTRIERRFTREENLETRRVLPHPKYSLVQRDFDLLSSLPNIFRKTPNGPAPLPRTLDGEREPGNRGREPRFE